MLPAAPARLSIVICRPRASDIGGAMKRATMSFVLPAANGTINLIVLVGYCASAGECPMNPVANAIRPLRIMVFMCLLLGQTGVHTSFSLMVQYATKSGVN